MTIKYVTIFYHTATLLKNLNANIYNLQATTSHPAICRWRHSSKTKLARSTYKFWMINIPNTFSQFGHKIVLRTDLVDVEHQGIKVLLLAHLWIKDVKNPFWLQQIQYNNFGSRCNSSWKFVKDLRAHIQVQNIRYQGNRFCHCDLKLKSCPLLQELFMILPTWNL